MQKGIYEGIGFDLRYVVNLIDGVWVAYCLESDKLHNITKTKNFLANHKIRS